MILKISNTEGTSLWLNSLMMSGKCCQKTSKLKKTLKNNNNQDWCSNESWALYSISFYGCGGRQQRPQFNNSLVIVFTMSM